MSELQQDVAGDERTTKSKVLEAGAGMTQVRTTLSHSTLGSIDTDKLLDRTSPQSRVSVRI